MAAMARLERAVPATAQGNCLRRPVARPVAPARAPLAAPAGHVGAAAGRARRGAALKAVAERGAARAAADPAAYETLVILRPDLSDEERDQELAKFEAFLARQAAADVRVTVRGRQRLAYPIKRFADGIYVLYTYVAPPAVSQAVQRLLSTPEAGRENTILRHMTFRLSAE